MDYYDIIAMRHQQLITGSSVKQIQSIIEDVLSLQHQKKETLIKADLEIAYMQGYSDKLSNIPPRPAVWCGEYINSKEK